MRIRSARQHTRSHRVFQKATQGLSEPVQAIYYNDQQPDKIFYQELAWKKLGNHAGADTHLPSTDHVRQRAPQRHDPPSTTSPYHSRPARLRPGPRPAQQDLLPLPDRLGYLAAGPRARDRSGGEFHTVLGHNINHYRRGYGHKTMIGA